MINDILNKLDIWVEKQNKLTSEKNLIKIKTASIYIIGQTALIEAGLPIELNATADIDIQNQLEYTVRKKLEELLSNKGKVLDPTGHEAWMPKETIYTKIFNGKNIIGFIAEPVFIILSKAKMAPKKNRILIADYIASKDLDHRLFELAKKYNVNLESLL